MVLTWNLDHGFQYHLVHIIHRKASSTTSLSNIYSMYVREQLKMRETEFDSVADYKVIVVMINHSDTNFSILHVYQFSYYPYVRGNYEH